MHGLAITIFVATLSESVASGSSAGNCDIVVHVQYYILLLVNCTAYNYQNDLLVFLLQIFYRKRLHMTLCMYAIYNYGNFSYVV